MAPGNILGAGPGPTAAEARLWARKLLGPLYDEFEFERLVPMTDDTAWHVTRRLAAEGLAGNFFHAPLMEDRLFGAYQSRRSKKSRVWSYLFSHPAPSRPEETGTLRDASKTLVWHSCELFYTFGSLRQGTPPLRPWKEEDFRLANQVSSYWANFIRTGDPNGEGLPTWPQSDSNYGFIELGDEVRGYTGIGPGVDRMIFEYYRRIRKFPE